MYILIHVGRVRQIYKYVHIFVRYQYTRAIYDSFNRICQCAFLFVCFARLTHTRTRAHVEKRAGDVRTSPQRRNARTDLRRSRAAHNLHSHHSFRQHVPPRFSLYISLYLLVSLSHFSTCPLLPVVPPVAFDSAIRFNRMVNDLRQSVASRDTAPTDFGYYASSKRIQLKLDFLQNCCIV